VPRCLKSACRHVGIKTLTITISGTTSRPAALNPRGYPNGFPWLGHSDGGGSRDESLRHLRQEHSDAQAAKVQF